MTGRAAMSHAVECRYHGRDFTTDEMALLRALIAGPPPLSRVQLSREFSRRIAWYKPDGGLKEMAARVAMLRMHRDGRIVLPAPQRPRHPPRPAHFTPATEPPLLRPPHHLEALRPLHLVAVTGADRQASRRWNEFIARYHYLGYKTLVGPQLRYGVHDRDGTALALLGFSTAAWKTAPRDRFIGWSHPQRENNLPLLVDNSRFLILPWVRVPNLASHILFLIRQRLAQDWQRRYNIAPVLIETFVERPRFTGASYRAAGWTRVGTTQGRGRYDTDNEYALAKKDIWLRPLRKDWKRVLKR